MISREKMLKNLEKARKAGSGRKLGSKNQVTIERERASSMYRMRINRQLDRLLDYQLALARGSTYLFKIEKEEVKDARGKLKFYRPKKPVLVDDVDEIRSYLEGIVENGDKEDDSDPAATFYFLTAKDPDRAAIKDIVEYGIGKAPQALDLNLRTPDEKLETFNGRQLFKLAGKIIAHYSASEEKPS